MVAALTTVTVSNCIKDKINKLDPTINDNHMQSENVIPDDDDNSNSSDLKIQHDP